MIGGISWVRAVGYAATLALLAGAAGAQQQPNLGVAPVTLADQAYVFDTAEQHGIRVSVVLRGLAHPFSFAFLPNGDALVAERSGALRLVRNAASGKGGAAMLEAQPVAGTPEKSAQPTGGNAQCR
jgi:glucose/arabinose dehydrogenase